MKWHGPRLCEVTFLERTLSIIKPDGVGKRIIGRVIGRFEEEGMSIVAMKMLHMTRAQAEGFYAVHRDMPFFSSLVEFMTSGPVVVMVLQGNNVIQRNRKIMGATDPAKADAGTIRAEFASDIEKNIVHGSDAQDTALNEISYFFSDYELR